MILTDTSNTAAAESTSPHHVTSRFIFYHIAPL